MDNFNELLDRYADLLVSYALNVQPGQPLFIHGEIIHRDLSVRMAKIAYQRGAKFVQLDLQPPELLKSRIELSDPKNLEAVPRNLAERYLEAVDEQASTFRFVGSEDPDLLTHLDPKKSNLVQLNFRKAIKRYYEEGVGHSKVAWSIGAYATPKWAKKLFPELSENDAVEKLWSAIFKICRVDQPNYIEAWKAHNSKLKERAAKLDQLKIATLHFTGPGTDLKVGLSPLYQFRGGGDLSSRGVVFEPNVPTEECFTTPDWHKTEGRARVTRPFTVNGVLVKDLEVVFKDGELIEAKAKEGEAAFKEYISSDPGARRLGEVALVGCDSPIYKSNIVFQEILYDENAACHIAVGFAYLFCIKGGDKLSAQEKEEIGCNVSHCHVDMMISDEKVNVDAIDNQGKATRLITNGYWEI